MKDDKGVKLLLLFFTANLELRIRYLVTVIVRLVRNNKHCMLVALEGRGLCVV